MLALRFLFLIGTFWMLQAAEPALQVAHIVGLEYPRLPHLAAMQGSVELMLSIGRDGSVHSVKVVSGNGLLADSAANVLKLWTFSPCSDTSGECKYPMSVNFSLRGGPVNISECKTEFQFDNPGQIIVASQYARAIVN